ncbi:cell division suppressor protein YneA [Bacillus rubiinfantis]|uniref:cell division suppressor protein YneA n=1 Tax=Bacillus rubiinfantis TaxID=1499680 RepID=UPI0005A75961|nr:LysM peptidoglycan-binding domain-containing protein [Bacillus rubiinfantis]
MKIIWNHFSYAIILILLSCIFAVVLSLQNWFNHQEQYIKVTVSEGDSLWKLSEQYSGQHSLTNEQFVSWVKKHNEKIAEQIYPGEKIIIPVQKKAVNNSEIVSAAE